MKKRQTLTFKMVLYVLITILPVNVFLIYLAKTAQDVTRTTVQANLDNIANVYMDQVERRMENINSFIWLLEDSDRNLKVISEEADRDTYYIAAMGLRQTLDSHILSYEDAEGYFFFSDLVESGMAVENTAVLSSNTFRDAVFADRALLADSRWRIQDIDGTQWYIHTNRWKQVYIGAGIHLDQLAATAQKALVYDTAQVYFSSDEEPRSGQEFFHAAVQCGRRNLYLHVDVENREIIQKLPLLQKIAYVLSLVWLMLIPLIIWIIHRLVLKPLGIINQAIQSFKIDPETRISSPANSSDFEGVNQSFNEMAGQIVKLKIDNYEREIQRQKLELRNLRLQIKPHFLFNSLNLMYNLVQMGETHSVQQMLLYLSDYFRYINVGDKDFSLFREELELIRKYVEVAKIRYPEMIEATFDVEESALDAQIPQLMVHNFVENTVKHGLDLTRMNHIQLRAWLDHNELVVEIEDDGIGMSSSQAEKVNRGIFEYEDGKRHLGLKNSYRRIQFYYGEHGHLHIDSQEDRGTRVTLRFPAQIDEAVP